MQQINAPVLIGFKYNKINVLRVFCDYRCNNLMFLRWGGSSKITLKINMPQDGYDYC